MAIIFTDGFDKYGPGFTTFQTAVMAAPHPTKMLKVLANEWLILNASGSADNIVYIGPPLSATGQSLGITAATTVWGVQKIFGTNYARAIGGIRFQLTTSTTGSAEIRLLETATSQCRISLSNLGAIAIINSAGTTIATFNGVFAIGSTHYLEWNVLCANAGTWQLWLDGVSLGSGSGVDFQGGSNAFYQTIQLVTVTGGGSNSPAVAFDDFYVDDGSGSPALTNPVVDTEFMTSDSSVQFTNAAYAVGFWNINDAVSVNIAANNLSLRKITPAVNVTLNSVSAIPVSTFAPCKWKAVLYADSAGAPAALLATGTEVVGATANTALILPFGSGQALTGGTAYWIGFINDTTFGMGVESIATTVGWAKNNTYTSGPPNPAGAAASTTSASWAFWGNCSGITANWRNEAEFSPLGVWGDFSYVTDNTVGHEDLHGVAALNTTPVTIYSVAVKAFVKDSAAGARTVTLRTKSSAVDDPGSNAGFTPATTYGWFSSYWLTDPNTSAAWTAANLNAALAGVKITA